MSSSGPHPRLPIRNRFGPARGFAVLGLLLLVAACQRPTRPPAPGAPAAEAALVIPAAKRAELYPFDPASSLASRIKPIPPQLLQYLRDLDETDAYRNHELSEAERALVEKNLANFPKDGKLGQRLAKRLTGIYFVKNFQGNGWTDFLVGDDNQLSVYMVFNPETLHLNISELLTKKENTAFIPDPAGKIRISIDCGTRLCGFTYILFHESAHAFDYIDGVTPYVEPALLNLPGYIRTSNPGIEANWTEYDQPAATISWPYRGRVNFFGLGGGPKLRADEAIAVYRALQATPFVSLYATTNWAEDLAELFAFVSLTSRLQCPYRISVKDGATSFSYEPMAQPQFIPRIWTADDMWYDLP